MGRKMATGYVIRHEAWRGWAGQCVGQLMALLCHLIMSIIRLTERTMVQTIPDQRLTEELIQISAFLS
ncbi:hypothetical protein BgiMline_009559 [Biomphalaria glabrata]